MVYLSLLGGDLLLCLDAELGDFHVGLLPCGFLGHPSGGKPKEGNAASSFAPHLLEDRFSVDLRRWFEHVAHVLIEHTSVRGEKVGGEALV